MTRRLKALLMLFIFGLLLPVAGSPQRYCTCFHSFLPQECCDPQGPCNHDPASPIPDPSSCTVSAKPLPDGIGFSPVVLPPLPAFILPDFALPAPLLLATGHPFPSHPFSRPPPRGSFPLFLTHRSLLI